MFYYSFQIYNNQVRPYNFTKKSFLWLGIFFHWIYDKNRRDLIIDKAIPKYDINIFKIGIEELWRIVFKMIQVGCSCAIWGSLYFGYYVLPMWYFSDCSFCPFGPMVFFSLFYYNKFLFDSIPFIFLCAVKESPSNLTLWSRISLHWWNQIPLTARFNHSSWWSIWTI